MASRIMTADGLDIRPRFEKVFEAQRAACAKDMNPGRALRRRRLATLESLLRNHGASLAAAVSEDFGHRSLNETRLLEIFPALQQLRYLQKHFPRWMRDERRHTSIWFRPGRSRVVHQPLGVVGIIAPWNYPILLAVAPLAAALAAGNRAMVKTSEFTPRTSALFAALVAKYFAPEEVAVVEGDAAVGQSFAGLPFDHLLFTGSTAVGHAVMRTAAENLTPVTLELGGKSPAIVGCEYPMTHAAERIMAGKCMNAGQTCIAPDYVLVPAGREEAFVAAARAQVARLYPDPAHSADYTSIINPRHFARLAGYLEEARAGGAHIMPLSSAMTTPDPATRRFPPVAVLRAPEDCALMRDEIFGPILPVLPYADLDRAIAHVNTWPRPLALYHFERDRARIERVLRETVAGGVTLNDTILHIAQDDLPFGGVGPSGMGHYHGREGFETFSTKKAVFAQSRWSGVRLFNPPYGRLFDALLRVLMR